MTNNIQDTVLIITRADDIHADAVIYFLYNLGIKVVRWHPSELNTDSIVGFDSLKGHIYIKSSNRELDITRLRSCWFRKPEPIKIQDQNLSEADRQLIEYEASAVVQGLYSCIDTVWYSHPHNLRVAGIKPIMNPKIQTGS